MDVGSCKTQDAESGVEEKVLPPVVLDQAGAVIVSVVLDHEPRRWVIEVGPTYEATFAISEISLDIWVRQTRLDEQPPKPGFHRRLRGSRALGQHSQPA